MQAKTDALGKTTVPMNRRPCILLTDDHTMAPRRLPAFAGATVRPTQFWMLLSRERAIKTTKKINNEKINANTLPH
jgi:hypothetical protein